MTLVATSRQTLRTELLHLIEDATFTGSGSISVKELVALTEKGETTVRKAVRELEAEGFIKFDSANGVKGRYVIVNKNEPDTSEGGDNMTTATKDKPAAKKAAAKAEAPKKGPGRPKDPEVQSRDAKALKLISAKAEGLSVAELAEALETTKEKAYISVWRLRVEGKIVKAPSGTRTPRWRKA